MRNDNVYWVRFSNGVNNSNYLNNCHTYLRYTLNDPLSLQCTQYLVLNWLIPEYANQRVIRSCSKWNVDIVYTGTGFPITVRYSNNSMKFFHDVLLIPLNFWELSVFALSQANQTKQKQQQQQIKSCYKFSKDLWMFCYYQMHKMEIALRKL